MTAPAGLPEGEAKVRAVQSMFDTIAPRYDLLNSLMTLGLDRSWRRRAVASLGLSTGSAVIDVACGPGELCSVLEHAGYRAFGVDMSFGMLSQSRTSSPLVQGDALSLPVATGSADGAVSGFALRNFKELPGFFAELARVLRPGGRFALLDVAQPRSRAVRLGHEVYFKRVVPRLGALLSDADAYAYLPRSLAYLPEPQVMVEQIVAAGFEEVERSLMTFGATQLITATRSW